MHGDNCKSVYCHWDGYLEGVGRTLLEHYDSSEANQLVAHGDISSLGERIVALNPMDHCFEKPEQGTTVFYGRDRKENNIDWKTDDTFEKFYERADGCGAEYYYIMNDGVWYVGTTYESDVKLGRKLVPLAEALADQDIETAGNWEQVTV
jgi:hypothetical protein